MSTAPPPPGTAAPTPQPALPAAATPDAVTPDATAPAAAPASKPVSLWDFVLFRQPEALYNYLSRLAANDERDGTALVARVLDQRVDQVCSARKYFVDSFFCRCRSFLLVFIE